MASYTIELRKVCEIYGRENVEKWFTKYNISDYLLPSQIEVLNKSNIWSKEKLAKKIVNHYFMREIGFETPALFKHYVEVTMNEIMEEKLPLIYTVALEYDPLVNVDFTEEFKRQATGNSKSQGKSNSNSNSSGLGVSSDTPQGQITKENILNGDYASSTSATENNINDNTETNNNINNENQEEYIRHLKGNQRNFCNLSSYDKTI